MNLIWKTDVHNYRKKISTHINKPYMGHLQWQMLQSRLILHTMEDQLSRNATIKNTFCPNLARGGKKIAGASNNRVTPTTNASTMSIRFLQWLHWCYSCQISIPIRSLSPASFSLFFLLFSLTCIKCQRNLKKRKKIKIRYVNDHQENILQSEINI